VRDFFFFFFFFFFFGIPCLLGGWVELVPCFLKNKHTFFNSLWCFSSHNHTFAWHAPNDDPHTSASFANVTGVALVPRTALGRSLCASGVAAAAVTAAGGGYTATPAGAATSAGYTADLAGAAAAAFFASCEVRPVIGVRVSGAGAVVAAVISEHGRGCVPPKGGASTIQRLSDIFQWIAYICRLMLLLFIISVVSFFFSFSFSFSFYCQFLRMTSSTSPLTRFFNFNFFLLF
jgi:hypothetical protein